MTADDVVPGGVEEREESTVPSEGRVVGTGSQDAGHDCGRYAFAYSGESLSDS